MEVEQPVKPAAPAGGGVTSLQHKRVPRWLRMSTRISLLVGLVALPALAVKEPSFERLFAYRGYNIVFVILGACVLPMWTPQLGSIVLAYTLVLPIGFAGLWLAYGLFLGCQHVAFMTGACVVVTTGVFFFAQLLSLPVGLLSVMVTIFVAAANSFLLTPSMALPMAALLSVLLVVAALLSVLLCWLVFPEFCVDEVFMHHHEGLEHLLHLAHHALGSTPPRLLRRVAASDAAAFGAKGSRWRSALLGADELPSQLPARTGAALAREPSMTGSADAAGGMTAAERVERSWYRAGLALEAAAKAQMGARAEVVLMAKGHKRIIVPCSPLLPCGGSQIHTQALLALRHLVLSTALSIYKLHGATHPLDEATAALISRAMTSPPPPLAPQRRVGDHEGVLLRRPAGPAGRVPPGLLPRSPAQPRQPGRLQGRRRPPAASL